MKAPTPETLTAVATTAAAIAAAAAVVTAAMQERATFNANLYSKQIDVVGAALIKINDLDSSILIVYNIIREIKTNDMEPYHRIEIMLPDIELSYSLMRESVYVMRIIVPDDYVEPIDDAEGHYNYIVSYLRDDGLPLLKNRWKEG